MKKQEAYDTLNVSQQATEDEIKKAFKVLAAKTHPDVNKDDPKAEEKFKKINEAYQILTGKAKAEDENMFNKGPQWTRANTINVEDFFTNFNPFYNNIHNSSVYNSRLENVNSQLQLTFEETILGTVRKMDFEIKNYCEHCERTGFESKNRQTCTTCKGKGFILNYQQFGFNVTQKACNMCHGYGYIGTTCSHCDGKKFKMEKISLNVKVPPIISNSDIVRLRLEKQGNKYKQERSNIIVDLYPTYIETTGKFAGYKLEGNNILSTTKVPLHILLFGGTVEVDTVYGEKHPLQIPKMARLGNTITIPQKGVKNTVLNISGHHFVKLELEYPKEANLTSEIKDSIEKLYI